MHVTSVVTLIVAGAVAGVVGTAGGITSLVSYPALLAVGLVPLTANVVNIVAVVACLPGAGFSSRHELEGSATWLRRAAPAVIAGATVGSLLLLTTSPGVFSHIVPFLVLLGAGALLAQPWITSSLNRSGVDRSGMGRSGVNRSGVGRSGVNRSGVGRTEQHRSRLVPAGLFTISLYSGYFGAGSGVMTLALLLIAVEPSITRSNALKNMVVGTAAVVSALMFVAFGSIDWPATLALGSGMSVGSTFGPRVARIVPASVLRWIVALTAVVLAIHLFLA